RVPSTEDQVPAHDAVDREKSHGVDDSDVEDVKRAVRIVAGRAEIGVDVISVCRAVRRMIGNETRTSGAVEVQFEVLIAVRKAAAREKLRVVPRCPRHDENLVVMRQAEDSNVGQVEVSRVAGAEADYRQGSLHRVGNAARPPASDALNRVVAVPG